MLVIKSKRQAIGYTTVLTCFVLVVIWVDVHLTMPLEMREFVLPRALLNGVMLATPLGWLTAWTLWRNYQTQQTLQRMVDRDRLTDVNTREFFFSRMENDPGTFGTSLLVDIDYFKKVNDTYGHLAGDAVIQNVALLLQQTVRDDDIVCRFGGEEFVIFLRHSDTNRGYALAERIREAIAEHVVEVDGTDVSVTVSIGGSLKRQRDDINQAIKDADDALYRAKEMGRNRTVFADTEPERVRIQR